jgi:acyl carrier protein
MAGSTVQRIAGIVAGLGRLGPQERIDGDTPLVGGGAALDSVSVLELLVGLENEFGIEVEADELLEAKALHSVRTLAAFIDAKR